MDSLDQFGQYPPIPLSSQDFPACTASMNGNILSPVSRGSYCNYFQGLDRQRRLIYSQLHSTTEHLSTLTKIGPIGILHTLITLLFQLDILRLKILAKPIGNSQSPLSHQAFLPISRPRQIRPLTTLVIL